MDAAAGRRYLSPIPQSRLSAAIGDDELNEDDILWSDDYNPSAASKPKPKRKVNHRRSVSFQHTTSGILAALPELNHPSSPLYRKPTVKTIPAPTQSAPGRKLKQSAPMKVPPMISIKQRRSRFRDEGNEDGRFDDEMMLPPHEIVARENWRQSSQSMLEGAGRTLKGRDLRQVRNAVFRQTGFLD
ncbi:hypothetical protein LINPERPRIM_LOCUS26808 [Linum perenne]